MTTGNKPISSRPSPLICLCHEVSLAQVQQAITDGATDLEQLRQKTDAGTLCCKCVLQLENLLTRYSANPPS